VKKKIKNKPEYITRNEAAINQKIAQRAIKNFEAPIDAIKAANQLQMDNQTKKRKRT